MKIFVSIIFILASVALTAIVLMQEGKDAGLGTIGGIGDTYWSKNKSRSMEGNMVKFTKLLAAVFLILAVLLNMMPDKNKAASTQTTTQTEASVSSTESDTEAAAAATEAAVAETETAAATEAAISAAAVAGTEAATTEASTEQ